MRLPDWLSSGVFPAQEDRCPPVRKRHVDAGLGDRVLGGAAAPAGHRLGLLELFLPGAQQPLDRLGQPGDPGVDLVDPVEHGPQQRGVLGGEELRALRCLLQLGDLGAGAGAGQLRQRLRGALPGRSGGP